MSLSRWLVSVAKRPAAYRRYVAVIRGLVQLSYPLARLTRIPGVGTLVDRLLFDGDRTLYLARDGVIPVNESVEQPGQMALPSLVVEHFIDQATHLFVMNKCLCRQASGCEAYGDGYGCLLLGRATEGISRDLGRVVTRAEARDHIGSCAEQGLVHMVGRNKMDSMWLLLEPGQSVLTICNCCECCCLYRALPKLSPQISDKTTKMPGISVRVTDTCTGCGVCTQGICFVNAIHLDGDLAAITDACRGCGRCVEACPEQAIELSIKDALYVEKSISHLSGLADPW